jgi:hypothetical protein
MLAPGATDFYEYFRVLSMHYKPKELFTLMTESAGRDYPWLDFSKKPPYHKRPLLHDAYLTDDGSGK